MQRGAHLLANFLKVEDPQRRNSPCKPLPVVLLLPDRVADEREVGQVLKFFQRLEVAEFCDVVVGQHERREIRG